MRREEERGRVKRKQQNMKEKETRATELERRE